MSAAYALKRGGADVDDLVWAKPIVAAFGQASDEVAREWLTRKKTNRKAGNEWLRDAHRILTGQPRIIRSLHNLDDIETKAHWCADQCGTLATDVQVDAFTLAHGLPKVEGDSGGPRIARAQDWQYWRRILRREVGRHRDQLMRHLGRVHKRRQVYCADSVVRWHQQRQAANLALLEKLEAVSDTGGVVNMADIYRASLANPALRRSELLARIRGFERWAEREGHMATFVTLTAPSKYHCRHSVSGDPIPNWNGNTPAEVQDYLNGVWKKIRTALSRPSTRKPLKRERVPIYGLRVAEPHHDGTPHWHFLLFHRVEHRQTLRRVFRYYALAEDGDEPGAHRYRVKFKDIDPDKGSATGYVIKYVAKSIDGYGVGEDLHGGEAEAAADRIVAWARTWGIRQFQQIGGPAVGVWREYWRIGPDELTSVVPPHHLPWLAVSVEKRWDHFMEYMGGSVPGRDQPSVLGRRPLVDPETGEMTHYRTRYGDEIPACCRPVEGVLREGVLLETRWHDWTIRPVAAPIGAESSAGGEPPALGLVSVTVREASQTGPPG